MKSIFIVFFSVLIVFCCATEQSEHNETLSKFLNDLCHATTSLEKTKSLIEKGNQLNYGKEVNLLAWTMHCILGYPEFAFPVEVYGWVKENITDLTELNYHGLSPLIRAVERGNIGLVIEFLKVDKANPNVYYKYEDECCNKSALQISLSSTHDGDEEISKLLIEYGADLNVTDEYGQTPLHQAIFKGFKTVIELLIEKGVNANAVDHWKLTPLHYIALVDSANEASKNWSQLESQAMEIVSELFERLMILDDDANETDDDGESPFSKALIAGQKETIERLISRGLNINNEKKRWKVMPLHYATMAYYRRFQKRTPFTNWTVDDSLKFAELFIEHGADVHAQGRFQFDSKTALDLATSEKLKEYLRSKMA